MYKLRLSKGKLILLVMAFSVLGLTTATQVRAAPQAPQAVVLTCSNEVRIGIMLSCKATGLTVGTSYRMDAQHSAGNKSAVGTASTTTEYFRVTFASADADESVPMVIAAANTSGARTGPDLANALVTLKNPAEDIPSAFFQNLLAAVLIIGVFVLLMSAFFINRGMKS